MNQDEVFLNMVFNLFTSGTAEDPWELFIQQGTLLVWRREVPNHRGEGLYEYKGLAQIVSFFVFFFLVRLVSKSAT